jgi:hypothetical protein
MHLAACTLQSLPDVRASIRQAADDDPKPETGLARFKSRAQAGFESPLNLLRGSYGFPGSSGTESHRVAIGRWNSSAEVLSGVW